MIHFLWTFLVLFLLISLGVLLIYHVIDMATDRRFNIPRKPKYSGTMICGTNHETGKPVYRVEFDIPLEDIPKNKKLVLRVTHTDENLGINQRLYDLEYEGIRHDD